MGIRPLKSRAESRGGGKPNCHEESQGGGKLDTRNHDHEEAKYERRNSKTPQGRIPRGVGLRLKSRTGTKSCDATDGRVAAHFGLYFSHHSDVGVLIWHGPSALSLYSLTVDLDKNLLNDGKRNQSKIH